MSKKGHRSNKRENGAIDLLRLSGTWISSSVVNRQMPVASVFGELEKFLNIV